MSWYVRFDRSPEHLMTSDHPTPAYLRLDSWAGRTRTLVQVIGQTPTMFRIRAVTQTALAGRCRWLGVGEETLVPREAIVFNDQLAQ